MMKKSSNSTLFNFEQFAKPIISGKAVEHYTAYTISHFQVVIRYMWPEFNVDFELLTSIDYCATLSDANYSEVIKYVHLNDNKYSNEELLYLSLRALIAPIWKLDVFLLTHLRKCFEIYAEWYSITAYFSQNNLDGFDYSLNGLPYWLKNEQINFLQNPHPMCDISVLESIELVIAKSNDIQAVQKALGNKKIIVLDNGIYVFLVEWCKLVLSGYRLREYCKENEYSLTEPIKTGSSLFIAIADVLTNRSQVYKLPPSLMLFSKNDPFVIKEIVMHQIDFILAHEYSHIILNHTSPCYSNEIDADLLSLSWIYLLDCGVATLNDIIDDEGNLPYFNDIQSHNLQDRSAESVELLFSFLELYYYVCDKKNYIHQLTDSHPRVIDRRRRIKESHCYIESPHLIEYADELSSSIKDNLDIILNKI